jgi:hypothetical protein
LWSSPNDHATRAPLRVLRIFRRSGSRRGRRIWMKQITRFDRLDRHQKALAGLARNAGIGAQLKIRTTAGFDQGQPHPLAARQAWYFGSLKISAGWRRHDSPSENGREGNILGRRWQPKSRNARIVHFYSRRGHRPMRMTLASKQKPGEAGRAFGLIERSSPKRSNRTWFHIRT